MRLCRGDKRTPFPTAGVGDAREGVAFSERLQRVLTELAPVEFKPWWAQATVGFASRF